MLWIKNTLNWIIRSCLPSPTGALDLIQEELERTYFLSIFASNFPVGALLLRIWIRICFPCMFIFARQILDRLNQRKEESGEVGLIPLWKKGVGGCWSKLVGLVGVEATGRRTNWRGANIPPTEATCCPTNLFKTNKPICQLMHQGAAYVQMNNWLCKMKVFDSTVSYVSTPSVW